MPDRRRHRGPHPRDRELFAGNQQPALDRATAEQSWLLTRGYTAKSALKLVGDRHALTARQRKAVSHCACGDGALSGRLGRRVEPEALRGEALHLDGFNVLIVLESALSGGLVMFGRDGCARDLASIHGSYRRVEETLAAVALVGETLAALGVSRACFQLDQPVSNSGRLKTRLRQAAAAAGWPWEVELVPNPDRTLVASEAVVASADAWVLDHSARWIDLAGYIVRDKIPDAWVMRLDGSGD